MKQKNKFLSLLLVIVAAGSMFANAQQKTYDAYRLYDNNGKAIDYQQMVRQLSKADVVFLGEIHNCAITHWLELRILQSLYLVHGKKLALGMEMFEADNQLILNEYLQGLIFSDRFEEEARIWPNYVTDYAPIVNFARENKIPTVATNVPRRYAAMVKEHGLAFIDSLSKEAKEYFPPLPIPYEPNPQAEQGFAMMRMLGGGKSNKDNSHLSEAQALKDATMAWHIAQTSTPKMLHINGNIHTDGNSGIITYLRKYAPKKKIITLRTVRQEDITFLDDTYKGLADYYLCVPEDMTNTY